MNISKIKNVKTPTRGTQGSAGIDFFIPEDFIETVVNPGQAIRIASGIRAEVPADHALISFNKSGVALSGLQVGACVVDSDYQGEINLHLFNVSLNKIILKPGQKLSQFILIPVNHCAVEIVDDKDIHTFATERAGGAFGSTGTN